MAGATAVVRRYGEGKILVASPRAEVREHFLKTLPASAGPAAEAAGGADALMKLAASEFGTLVLDPELEDLDVEELVATIRSRYPQLEILILDQIRDSDRRSLHLTRGTLRCLPHCAPEPDADSNSPIAQAATAVWANPLQESADAVRQEASVGELLPDLIGRSAKIKHVCRLARLVAPRDTAVLVVGATGTGKEVVARGIHALSRRATSAFVVVNCAAIPESLLEAELFGFTRGAFTGAFQSRLGRIHAAHGGTLLLDEVGELPLSMQAKLLRFVQEGEVQRLGSAETFRVDVRLIAATNANLLERVREKQFREDLYYRLAIFPLELPPLRDRVEDILPLAQRFLEALCRQAGVPQKRFSIEAAHVLCAHHWPGNVRELQHVVERAFVLSEARPDIRGEDLSMPSGAA